MYDVFYKEVRDRTNVIDIYLDQIDEIMNRVDISDKPEETAIADAFSLIRNHVTEMWYLSVHPEKCMKREIRPRRRHH